MSSPNPGTVRDHATALAYLEHGQCKANRPLANNTRLILKANGDVAVRLHNTDVVTYHPDGTATIYTGGWLTVTTKDRINAYAPVGAYSTGGLEHERLDGVKVGDDLGPEVWGIWGPDAPTSDPRVSWCRKCRKRGRVPVTCYGPSRWRDQDECEHGRTERHPNGDRECYGCHGAGETDYGSRKLPAATLEDHDRVRVDSDGAVVDGPPASVTDYVDLDLSVGRQASPYGIADDEDALDAPIGTEQTYTGGHWHGYKTVAKWAKSQPKFGHHSKPSKPSKPSVSGSTVTRGLLDVLPNLEGTVAYPCECRGPGALRDAIVHLNDSHRWTREQVADWLETLDLDLRFPASASTEGNAFGGAPSSDVA